MRSIVVGGASYIHIELTVSYFDISGVSSNEALRSLSAEEQRRVFLSLMPEYVLDTLNYYREKEQIGKTKQKLYDEYLMIKNGKMGFVINWILGIKKVRRKIFRGI